MSQEVHDMFARIAKRYDLANRMLSAGRDVRWRKHALRMLTGQGLKILDLACGTFDLSLDALDCDKASTVIAADFCPPMLHAGLHKCEDKAIYPCAGNGMQLPFADNSFDAVIMAYGWRNVDKPTQCLEELHRVLKNNGQLMILEFFKPQRWWPAFFYASFGRFVFPLVGGIISGDASAYRYLRKSILSFYNCDEATAALKSSGFHRIQWHSYYGGVSHAVLAQVNSNA